MTRPGGCLGIGTTGLPSRPSAAAPRATRPAPTATDGTYVYCYDAENRLTNVCSSGSCASPGTTVATYAYDAQGRRKSKTVGGVITVYVTDPDNNEVLEYNGSTGAVNAWYAYGGQG